MRDPERERERLRALSKRPDQVAKKKAYREAHREEMRLYWQAYGAKHRAELNAKEAQARAEGRRAKRTRSLHALYNTRQRGGTIIDRVDTDVVFARDRGICGICLEPVEPDRWHLDHIVPIAAGGEHSYANVRVTHPACNQSKTREARRLKAERVG